MFLPCDGEQMCLLQAGHVLEEPPGGSGVVLRPLNISSGKCCKTPKAAGVHSQDKACSPRMKGISPEASAVTLKQSRIRPSIQFHDAQSIIPSFFPAVLFSFFYKTSISPRLHIYFSLRSLVILTPRLSKPQRPVKGKQLRTLSLNPNFLLGSKINSNRVYPSPDVEEDLTWPNSQRGVAHVERSKMMARDAEGQRSAKINRQNQLCKPS